eukprot:CAMPEP_0172858904 /NCGR_PEP_ID=MMETSP1075-20121228/68287_1 /TAXON_ID=2916 /ORGANISM="Ceratium fusus, Strain PA161109" /LENGTH=97 /DNA_ID=CAMNT_0013706565 /DNA_START=70 /DNA_END=363 /DNA_ORIENTATION=-
MMCGGNSQAEDVNDEKKAQFEGYKEIVEAEAGTTYSEFTAVKYTQQVVAGMNYSIKYHVGDGAHIHAKVYVPLPFTGEPPSVSAIAKDQTADSEIAL